MNQLENPDFAIQKLGYPLALHTNSVKRDFTTWQPDDN
jgi:hypothetical protein